MAYRYYIVNAYDSFNIPQVRLIRGNELKFLRLNRRVETLVGSDDFKEISRMYREEYL